MTTRRAAVSVFLAVLVAVSVSAGLAATVGVVGADHGEPDADYTVEPMSDRSPGATNVRYGQVVVGQTGENFRTLESMKAVYEEGSWADCGPDRSEVFGIDRGNTHDGYEIDEDLTDNTKTFSAGEDVFEVEFYGEDDFGSSTHLDSGDAVVSVAQCIDNPDEPGWYQISGSTTGVTEDGERKTIGGESHYFWVCDCEDEAEAREELGPPPSEPQQTATPEGTPTGDGDGSDDATDGASRDDGSDESASGDGSGEGPASTDDDTTDEEAGTGGDDDATAEATATFEAASDSESGDSGGSGGSAGSAATGDEATSWDEHRVSTPTPGDGDGFGGLVALGALLGAALLFSRRT